MARKLPARTKSEEGKLPRLEMTVGQAPIQLDPCLSCDLPMIGIVAFVPPIASYSPGLIRLEVGDR